MSMTKQTGIKGGNHPESEELMELVVSRSNMEKAYQGVVKNQGAAGIDGMSVLELKPYLHAEWKQIKGALLSGAYYPQGIRPVRIAKPDGGERELGIPTVLDRLIQQALHQVLSPIFDPSFSEHSYGFRPGRSAQGAVLQAQSYINEGNRWVVDMDLAKFFDEVPHARLLSKLRNRIKDRRVVHLIDRYLRAGMMKEGLIEKRSKGTPQGSPLSPLLSNIVLDELDKELEKRGHRFVRYADDFQIYVRTKRSAERVMQSMGGFIETKLCLRVNMAKSEVNRPWKRSFLGHGFTNHKEVKLKPSKESLKRLRKKVKGKFRAGKGRNLERFIGEDLNPILRGWMHYFKRSEVKGFAEELDGWVRRHLRKVKWRQWKRNWTRKEGLEKRGLTEAQAIQSAFNGRGAWWNAGASHMNQAFPKRYFDRLGLVSLTQMLLHEQADRRTVGTAVIRNRTSGGVRGVK